MSDTSSFLAHSRSLVVSTCHHCHVSSLAAQCANSRPGLLRWRDVASQVSTRVRCPRARLCDFLFCRLHPEGVSTASSCGRDSSVHEDAADSFPAGLDCRASDDHARTRVAGRCREAERCCLGVSGNKFADAGVWTTVRVLKCQECLTTVART